MTQTLDITARAVIGKQVSQLRREGIVPGIIYGATVDNTIPMQVPWSDLRPVLLSAGGTEMLELRMDGQSFAVLIREVQRHPYRGDVMHVDFVAVDTTQTVHASVPIIAHGIDAVRRALAVNVFQPLTAIDVECLPTHIPNHIEFDVTVIKKAGDNLLVSDLPELEGVKYLSEPDAMVIRTVSIVEEEEESEDLDGAVEMGEVEVIGRGKDEDEEEE